MSEGHVGCFDGAKFMKHQLHSSRLPSLSLSLSLSLSPVMLMLMPMLAASACGGSTTSPGASPDTAGDSGTPPVDAAADTGNVQVDSGAADTGTQPEAGPQLYAVPLTSCQGVAYTAPVTLGGSQTFQLVIDTGSSSLGVASSTCSNCGVTPTYTPGSTAVDKNMPTSIQYESGGWSGEVYQDTAAVGSSPAATVDLAAITSQTMFFQGPGCDEGIIGFGPPAAVAQGTDLWFNQFVSTTHLPNVFATELCDSGGTLWLGGYDPSATTAAPQYTPKFAAVENEYHAVTLTSITVAGQDAGAGTSVSFTNTPVALVDTGTSLFYLNSTAYASVIAAIEADPQFASTLGASFFPASGAAEPNCVASGLTKAQLDATLPALTLTFGTGPTISVQALPTESYLLQIQNQWCSSLMGADVGNEPIAGILGAAFLRSNVVIFDQVNDQIGFAPHTACP
jgi:hypothetical protein